MTEGLSTSDSRSETSNKPREYSTFVQFVFCQTKLKPEMIKKLAKPPAGSGINPGLNEVIEADRHQIAKLDAALFWN